MAVQSGRVTVALRIAARDVSWPLLGVIVYGTSDTTAPGMISFAQGIAELPALTPMALEPETIRSFFYSPDGSYSPAVLGARMGRRRHPRQRGHLWLH